MSGEFLPAQRTAGTTTAASAAEADHATAETSLPAPAALRVRVKTMSGDVFPVDVAAIDTVASLKHKIRALNPEFEFARQRLVMMRNASDSASGSAVVAASESADFEVLDSDARTLASYGVTSDAAIELLIHELGPFSEVHLVFSPTTAAACFFLFSCFDITSASERHDLSFFAFPRRTCWPS
jgi:hypothetical protein